MAQHGVREGPRQKRRASHAARLAALFELGIVNMDIPIEYRTMKNGDESQVFTFIEGVFNKFVAPEFSKEGIEEFMKYIQPDALINHLKKNHFGILSLVGSKIIGVIMVCDYNHVALFFVDSQHQRRGIGRELFSKALEHCSRLDVNTSQITVNASPNSVNAYKNLNFEPTDKEQCINGIRFVPMIMRLQQTGSG
jgi:GNAT superfamily N-acetyltransferase